MRLIPSKRVSHLLEYCALRAIQFLLAALPRSVALKGGAIIGAGLYHAGIYRSVVRKNMMLVDLWPLDEQERITRLLYRTMGRYAVDFLRGFPPLPPYTVAHEEILSAALAKGKGVIILLGHFGNWELLADIFGSRVASLSVVAKPMRNPLVDRWLAKKRDAAAVDTIYVDNALRKIYEALKRNGIVAVLIDQHAGTQGTLVPFLGRETSTIRTVAGLEYKTGCAVVPTYALLCEDNTYEIVLAEAPLPEMPGQSDDAVIAACQVQHNDILSEWVRRYPHHWFGWFHKRFKESIDYRA
jgi:KDO2-lipid IV(A) lauroyltransferase